LPAGKSLVCAALLGSLDHCCGGFGQELLWRIEVERSKGESCRVNLNIYSPVPLTRQQQQQKQSE
jgi:hypothetical protein